MCSSHEKIQEDSFNNVRKEMIYFRFIDYRLNKVKDSEHIFHSNCHIQKLLKYFCFSLCILMFSCCNELQRHSYQFICMECIIRIYKFKFHSILAPFFPQMPKHFGKATPYTCYAM